MSEDAISTPWERADANEQPPRPRACFCPHTPGPNGPPCDKCMAGELSIDGTYYAENRNVKGETR